MTRNNFTAGIIGYGNIGQVHAKGYLADGRVTRLALADPYLRREQISAGMGAYTDSVQMLETERPAAVSICVPHHLHYPVALEVAKYGRANEGSVRYVLLEKPMAMNDKEAAEIEARFKAAGITLMIAHSLRFSSPFRRVAELLKPEASPFGRPILMLGNYLMYKDYSLYPEWKRKADEAGGGVLLRDGLHVLDAILNVAGSNPVEVWGQSARLANEAEIEDTFLGGIRFENQALAQLSFSSVGRADNQLSLTVHTPVATLKATLEQFQIWTEGPVNGASLPPAASQPQGATEPAEGDLWATQMAYFIDCAVNDKQPEVTAADGRRVLRVIERLYEAARLGRHLPV